jgi:hypothetical protein
MGIHLLPKSKTGKCTAKLFLGSLIAFLVFQILIWSGQRGGDHFFSNLYLTIPFLTMFLLLVSCFFLGIYSVIKHRDFSILLAAAIGMGGIALLFGILEVAFPH